MSANTKIEWTQRTWNPIRARLCEETTLHQHKGLKILPAGTYGYHCEPVSPGCKLCYAEAMNMRTLPAWGTGLAYNVPNRSRVEIFLDEEEMAKPLSWKKPTTVFPCSMTDWCADFVTDEMRDKILAVCALTPRHTYQFLTKRSQQMHAYFDNMGRVGSETAGFVWDRFQSVIEDRIRQGLVGPVTVSVPKFPLANVWLGVSVESRDYLLRIDHLRRTLAAVRFLSLEPLLEDLGDISRYLLGEEEHGVDLSRPAGSKVGCCVGWTPGIDWVIVGGESGPGSRPMHPDWVRNIREQCVAERVPLFFKQWGQFQHGSEAFGGPRDYVVLADGRYYLENDFAKFQAQNRDALEHWSEMKPEAMGRVGKKKAGRLLDGRTWDEMPEVEC